MAKPGFIPPMLATLVGGPFDDPAFLFEVKWDGFRVEAVVDGGGVRLWTRGEKDAAERYFGPFLEPPTWIAAGQAVVDGEVIALDARGEPDFALLQARIKGRGVAAEPTPFVYEVFDLLHLDGRSLLDQPLEQHRRLLASAREHASSNAGTADAFDVESRANVDCRRIDSSGLRKRDNPARTRYARCPSTCCRSTPRTTGRAIR